MSVTSILAIGMVLVIVAGQIDLSVGALAGPPGRAWPRSPTSTTAGRSGVAFAGRPGLGGRPRRSSRASLVACLQIPPFIVTLGGMLLFQGALLGITGGVAVSPVAAVPLRRARPTCRHARLGWLARARGGRASSSSGVRADGGDRAVAPRRPRRPRARLHRGHERATRASRCPCCCVLALAAFFSGVAQPHAASAATSTRSAATARRRSTPASPSSATSSACSPLMGFMSARRRHRADRARGRGHLRRRAA